MLPKVLRGLLLPLSIMLMSGCSAVVMSPSGDIAWQQRDLIVASTVLMLLIVVPVILLTLVFAWHYRQSNTKAHYDPHFHHSTGLELIIWSAPLLIIIALGAMTWITTHTLDPFRKLNRIAAAHPVAADAKPLRVQAVAMDWKWLFIYPDYGIATVNEMAAPVDVPISFQITSDTVMNAFFVPALAGMVYAMPAMDTQLHAVINQPGTYLGFSGNYSGAGFSDMHFNFFGQSQSDFDAWVQKVKAAGGTLDRDAYLQLEKPSQADKVRGWGAVEPGLYGAIVNLCADPHKMCVHDMMKADAKGGLGLASAYNVGRLTYDIDHSWDGNKDKDAAPLSRPYVLALCSVVPGAAPLSSPAAFGKQ
jgi:cytochrome o ubiquinol oxidase subunit II